ncbi:MAG: type III-B CRISPR module RAMP protein Cmr6 [Thermoleophilia bacterium]
MIDGILPLAKKFESVESRHKHPGLQLDKLSYAENQEAQKDALSRVVACKGHHELLEKVLKRRTKLLGSLQADRWSGRTNGPLTLHLARASILENAGICLHPIYGFAYLPGSGLKGMARAYAEAVWLEEQDDQETAQRRIDDVFGWALSPAARSHPVGDLATPSVPHTVTDNAEGELIEAAAGSVVFHDAWPESWPQLAVDIVNNHHKDYYGASWYEAIEPGDWEDPRCVYFLSVVPGVNFHFALSWRAGAPDNTLLSLAKKWLSGALMWQGAGAKTAAGYGRFKFKEEDTVPAPEVLKTDKTTVRLVTPAFLAGANQGREDCDLRSATLRGLLRWWWRTLHADRVTSQELRALETAVWGSMEQGGAVSVSVVRKHADTPQSWQRVKYESFVSPAGLHYLSYGMNDGDTRRYFMPSGASWDVTLVARSSVFAGTRSQADGSPCREISLRPELILKQAQAALWLLRHFGGVGSKGRNGFGSLDEDNDSSLTLEWCVQAASEFRRVCELDALPSAAYSESYRAEIELSATDYWWVLGELGKAVRDFARSLKQDGQKEALGLPRLSLGQSHPKRGERPPEKMRHAAPILYHVGKASAGTLSVRIVAFPQRYLPNLPTSRSVLQQAVDSVSKAMMEAAKRVPSGGARPVMPVIEQQLVVPTAPLDVPPKGSLEEFETWFDAGKFSATNKGEHNQIRQKIDGLESEELRQQAKEYVKSELKKKKSTTTSLWEYLNS